MTRSREGFDYERFKGTRWRCVKRLGGKTSATPVGELRGIIRGAIYVFGVVFADIEFGKVECVDEGAGWR